MVNFIERSIEIPLLQDELVFALLMSFANFAKSSHVQKKTKYLQD